MSVCSLAPVIFVWGVHMNKVVGLSISMEHVSCKLLQNNLIDFALGRVFVVVWKVQFSVMMDTCSVPQSSSWTSLNPLLWLNYSSILQLGQATGHKSPPHHFWSFVWFSNKAYCTDPHIHSCCWCWSQQHSTESLSVWKVIFKLKTHWNYCYFIWLSAESQHAIYEK